MNSFLPPLISKKFFSKANVLYKSFSNYHSRSPRCFRDRCPTLWRGRKLCPLRSRLRNRSPLQSRIWTRPGTRPSTSRVPRSFRWRLGSNSSKKKSNSREQHRHLSQVFKSHKGLLVWVRITLYSRSFFQKP